VDQALILEELNKKDNCTSCVAPASQCNVLTIMQLVHNQQQNGNYAAYGAQYRQPAISIAVNSYALRTLLTPYPFTATL